MNDGASILTPQELISTTSPCPIKSSTTTITMASTAGDFSKNVTPGDLSFVQISDSHIGFSKEANKDVLSTLKVAIVKINALPPPPAFVLHTGDLSHLSKPEEFDALDQ